MKQFSKKILFLLVGTLLVSACTDEAEYPGKKINVVEGIPVEASIYFQTDKRTVVTRANNELGSAVEDFYVVLFNKDGSYSGSQYFTKEELLPSLADNDGRVKMKTTSGLKTIYGVANVTSNNFISDNPADDLRSRIDLFVGNTNKSEKTLEKWLEFTAMMSDEYTTWAGDIFLMSGKFIPNDTEANAALSAGQCLISEDGSISAGVVRLDRAVATVKFNISGAGFVPESWQVMNLPKGVHLFNDKAITGVPEGEVFNYTNASTTFNQQSFSFSMLENLNDKVTGFPTTGDDFAREQAKWREGNAAPETSTYIVLKGSYSGNAKYPFEGDNKDKDLPASATVTYYIHLGYIDGAGDFSIKRNHQYTYNVTINGVNDIIVEATTEEEDNPRSDGEVVFAEGDYLELDAHYGRVFLTFQSGESLGDYTFVSKVKTVANPTPWAETEVDEPGADINWVYFVDEQDVLTLEGQRKNPDFSDPANNSMLMTINNLAAAFKPDGKYYKKPARVYAYVSENYYSDRPLVDFVSYSPSRAMDKARTMSIAIKQATPSGNASVVSTARYVIRQKPIVTFYNLDEVSHPWGLEWFNENLPSDYETLSPRDKSKAGLNYGLSAGERSSGYENGLTLMKEELANKDLLTASTGWFSADIIGERTTKTESGSGTATYNDWDLYKAKAYAACMSRNRDENGNGKIDQNEIKWYLPAINQYQHLWIGTNALPNAAKLYPAEFQQKNWEFFHYAASGGHVYWAEEGNAVSFDLGEYSNPKLGYGTFHVRCARNLAKEATDTYDPIADKNLTVNSLGRRYTSSGYYELGGYVTVTVGDRLTNESLRSDYLRIGMHAMHNEYSDENKIYKALDVATLVITPRVDVQTGSLPGSHFWRDYDGAGGGLYWGDMAKIFRPTSHEGKGRNPCEEFYGTEGWRPPTQNEVILITSVLGEGADNNEGYKTPIQAQTYYSFWNYETNTARVNNPNGDPRQGFGFSGSYMTLSPGKYRLRCVRDARQ
ncbi:hypothetical protein LJC54_03750 [Parabacteroides sp. OttesenSCG-928-J18]|nr:hypothetical protein [Parabacteroides sp. OttesenSCG-928-J18]